MNEHVRSRPIARTTRAAEGLPRRAWTTAELVAMVAAGIIDETERIELIGGEIVPMSPKGRRHSVVADELARLWTRRLPEAVSISIEQQFNLDPETFCEPDIIVCPRSIKTYDLKGPEALLVVEVAETSYAYDTGAKAKLYATYGVREYWVIEAVTLVTRVHRQPSAEGFRSVVEVPATEPLAPLLVPEMVVRLADYDFA
jgi:Uma2 family endonuclease